MLEAWRQMMSQAVGALSSLAFYGTGGDDDIIPDEN